MMNRQITISVGESARSVNWQNYYITWPQLRDRLLRTTVTAETYYQYMKMSPDRQAQIKDVGGFVGGYISGGNRSKSNIVYRSVITLDIDNGNLNLPYELYMRLNFAFLIHGTHKHSLNTPRYRLIIPTDRDLDPVEYQAVSRRIAQYIGMHLFDKTTFQSERLMYWPSTSIDMQYYAQYKDSYYLSVNSVLNTYYNYRDIQQWPLHPDEQGKHVALDPNARQKDPTEKTGIVGMFCRAFSIEEAIDRFLPHLYVRSSETGRYTYTQGTTANGMITYDGKFAYSHHSTDPAADLLCNAFDLVRIHLFGHLDVNSKANGAALPSYKEMERACYTLPEIKEEAAQKLINDIKAFEGTEQINFNNPCVQPGENSTVVADRQAEEDSLEWVKDLERNKTGVLPTYKNLKLIFNNDPKIKGLFSYDEFNRRICVMRVVPGIDRQQYDINGNLIVEKYPKYINDSDEAALRSYISLAYGIEAKNKIEDLISIAIANNRHNPLKEFLLSKKWDGVKRIDEVLIKCFGVEDNIYTREVSRKFFVAAVARALNPGCKFDNVLTLVGEEGIGKSTFFSSLAGEWFTDDFKGVKGNQAVEQLAGKWIMEIGELSGLKKQDVEDIKSFLSSQVDVYRTPYGKHPEDIPRSCIFAATTNEMNFLRGSQNRRFWPVTVRPEFATLSPLSKEFKNLISLLWGEAVEAYKQGEFLDLSSDARVIAQEERETRTIKDERVSIVEEFLNIPLPSDWYDKSPEERTQYIQTGGNPSNTLKRETISIIEIATECFKLDRTNISPQEAAAIRGIMSHLKKWKHDPKQRRLKHYGVVRGYKLKTVET